MSKKRILLIFILLVLIAIFFVFYFVTNDGFSVKTFDHKHLSHRSLMYLEILATDIQYAIDRDSGKMPISINEIVDLLYSIQPHSADSFSETYLHIDKDRKNIIDFWGNPILLQVNSKTEYVLISFGPDKKRDGELNDDIAYTFNPLVFIEGHD